MSPDGGWPKAGEITEGCKKGYALSSRGECAISLSDVWNYQRTDEPLPRWKHVLLEDREVYRVFGSDFMTKSNVQLTLERLVSFVEGKELVASCLFAGGGHSWYDQREGPSRRETFLRRFGMTLDQATLLF